MLFNLKSKINPNLSADHREELVPIKRKSIDSYYITMDNIEYIEGNNPKELLKFGIELLGMLIGFVDLRKYKL